MRRGLSRLSCIEPGDFRDNGLQFHSHRPRGRPVIYTQFTRRMMDSPPLTMVGVGRGLHVSTLTCQRFIVMIVHLCRTGYRLTGQAGIHVFCSGLLVAGCFGLAAAGVTISVIRGRSFDSIFCSYRTTRDSGEQHAGFQGTSGIYGLMNAPVDYETGLIVSGRQASYERLGGLRTHT